MVHYFGSGRSIGAYKHHPRQALRRRKTFDELRGTTQMKLKGNTDCPSRAYSTRRFAKRSAAELVESLGG
jgi:hypothetical protein